MPTFDFSGTKSNDPVSGVQNVIVEEAEWKEGAKGPYLVLRAAVLDGEFAGAWLWTRIFFSEKSMQFARQKLEAHGLKIEAKKNVKIDEKKLIGSVARWECAIEPHYETGEPTTQVTAIYKPAKSDLPPATADDFKAEFNATEDEEVPF